MPTEGEIVMSYWDIVVIYIVQQMGQFYCMCYCSNNYTAKPTYGVNKARILV